VLARDGAMFYAAQKFMQRHRLALAIFVTASLCIALLTGVWLSERNASLESVAQANAVEEVLKGMLDGVDPEIIASKTFDTKELLDQVASIVRNVGFTAKQHQLVFRVADLYDSAGSTAFGIRLLESHVQRCREVNDRERLTSTLARLASGWSYVRDVNKAEAALAEAEALQQGARQPSVTTQLDVLLAKLDIQLARKQFASVAGTADRALHLADRGNDVVIARANQAKAYAEAYLGLSRQARKSYQSAMDAYRNQGVRGTASATLMGLQIAELDIENGEYFRALLGASDGLSEFSKRFPAEHRYALQARYVLIAALVQTGNTERARAEQKIYATAARDNSAHAALASFFDARISVYEGNLLNALHQIETFEIGATKSDPNLPGMRRLKAEVLLRMGELDKALAILGPVQANADSSTNSEFPGVLSIALYGIALSANGDAVGARTFLGRAIDTLKAQGRDKDDAIYLARAYLALASPDASERERTDLAEYVERRFFWQPSAKALAESLRASPTAAPKTLPIVF
jgi:hypothetical protein